MFVGPGDSTVDKLDKAKTSSRPSLLRLIDSGESRMHLPR